MSDDKQIEPPLSEAQTVLALKKFFSDSGASPEQMKLIDSRLDRPATQRDLYELMSTQRSYDIMVLKTFTAYLGNDVANKAEALKALSRELTSIADIHSAILGAMVFRGRDRIEPLEDEQV